MSARASWAVPCLIVAACGREQPPRGPSVDAGPPPAARTDTVAGVGVRILGANACVLVYGDGAEERRVPLQLPSPCRLHRDTDGSVRVHDTAGGRHVFLVEHSVPDAERPGDCRTQIQAVVLAPDGAHPSTGVERVATCLPAHWDEVMFLGLFDKQPA